MQYSSSTLAFKPLIPFCPFCVFSLCSLTTASCSWLSFCASCLHSPPDSLRVLQWNAGGLRARSTELLHSLSSHLVDLVCIQESKLKSSSSFQIPGFSTLQSNRTHSRSDILVMPRKLASASSFSSGRAYPSLNFLHFFFA